LRRFFAVVLVFFLFAIPIGTIELKAQATRPRVIVFVHGIHSDRECWRAPNGAYWPQMLQKDPHFQKSDVVVAEYPTPSMRGQYSSTQLADLLWQQLRQKHVWEHREVVFIAHSLGGILTEEMLLRHPADAARVRFVVSYATPHQGSFVAGMAKIYDRDPLLTDLQPGNDNSFLIDLEQKWRGSAPANRIHRYCAWEALDTSAATQSITKYLGVHARVVSYYSATYGCDTDTPPQKIIANHIDIVRPGSVWDDAYTFFARVYHNNPVIEVVESVRDNKIAGLNADCNHPGESEDLQVPIALDPSRHEQLISATAELVDTDRIRDISPPVVKRVDAGGIAHVAYAFKGERRAVLGCPVGHASILVHFTVRSEVPVAE
jgi:triacylglycerol esterase/lipase EstA (alpha/beta hydrolase family)